MAETNVLLMLIFLVCNKVVNNYRINFGECIVMVNENCDTEIVKFILSTKNGLQTVHQEIDPVKPLMPAHFNKSIPLKIIIHGYGTLYYNAGAKATIKAYESLGYNIIIVNWEELSHLPCYVTSFLNIWYVGQCTAVLAVSLIPFGITPKMLHILGFSLGAHIAGLSSNHLQRTLNVSVGRITGLDPALPFFASKDEDTRKLEASDADFVDIIHTSAGSFGKVEATGHIDFYVNGGFSQKHCENYSKPLVCSHNMAGKYFAESITGDVNFVGYKCKTLPFRPNICRLLRTESAVMGDHINTSKRGTYLVTTAAQPPFALGWK